MKNKLYLLSCFISFSFSFFSCSLINDIKGITVPQTVTVKTDADYSIPLGKTEFNLSDHFSVDQLTDSLTFEGSEGNFAVYNYKKTDKTQAFLVDYTLKEIPLDISSYLSNLDGLDFNSAENSFSQEISIPSFENNQISQEISVDFNKLMRENFDCQFNIPSVPELNLEDEIPLDNIIFDISSPEFDSIEFAKGKIVLSATTTDTVNGSIALMLTLTDSNGKFIGNSEKTYIVENGVTTGKKIEFDVSGKSITPKMTINCSVVAAGGTVGNFHTFNVALTLSDDTTISKITNLTLDDEKLTESADLQEKLSFAQEIDTTQIQEVVESAEVSEGNINFAVKSPSGWSGITVNPEINLTGALNILNSDFTDAALTEGYLLNKNCSLAEKKLFENGPENISVNGKLNFSIKNANLSFNYDETGTCTDKFTFEASTTIKSLKSAKIKIAGMLDPSLLTQEVQQNLPDEVSQFIDSITFKELGIDAEISTDLDFGETLPLSGIVNSSFFKITNGKIEQVIDSSSESTTNSPYNLKFAVTYEDPEGIIALSKTDPNTIDFKIAMNFISDTVEIGSVTLGQTSTFDVNVKVHFDWTEVALSLGSLAMNDEIDTGINLKKLIKDSLGEDTLNDELINAVNSINLAADSIQGNICLSKPVLNDGETDIFEAINGFSGDIIVNYDSQDHNLIAEDSELNFTDKTVSSLANEDLEIAEEDYTKNFIYGKLNSETLVGMINSSKNLGTETTEETLKLKYDFNLAGDGNAVTVTSEQVKNLQESGSSTSIKVGLSLIIALDLAIDNSFNLNVLEVMGSPIESDLLNRSSRDEKSDALEMLEDFIDSICLDYSLWSNTGLTADAVIVAYDETDSENPYFEKSLSLSDSDSKSRLKLTNSDVKQIINHYPFIPEIRIKTTSEEEQKLTIRTDTYFGVKGIFTVGINGNYEVVGGKSNE